MDVEFGNGGLSRKTTMKFTIIRAPSPYNVILGRSGLKALRAIPSTIHALMKFQTPRGIATLVTWSIVVKECRKLEDKQTMCDGETGSGENRPPEEVMVNPAHPNQLVVVVYRKLSGKDVVFEIRERGVIPENDNEIHDKRAPSPYNVILGRSGLKALRAIPSTIHAMMKFPTPRGIATLVTRSIVVSECRKLEDKQTMCDRKTGSGENRSPEEVMVNLAYLDQLVTIGGNLTKEYGEEGNFPSFTYCKWLNESTDGD
ncbi:hypothetical protein CTI12_AA444400 [Artemisia annua]|uniref:Reverse transcriptase domain-containing protein n=1 Tax=Artemisia annua TaxID=35608 RepID=A0A2U1LWY6_ARTAN|nr:hypothetical protein CTI12_AA444400 [Artemisia annua]